MQYVNAGWNIIEYMWSLVSIKSAVIYEDDLVPGTFFVLSKRCDLTIFFH